MGFNTIVEARRVLLALQKIVEARTGYFIDTESLQALITNEFNIRVANEIKARLQTYDLNEIALILDASDQDKTIKKTRSKKGTETIQ